MARPITLFTGQWADLPLETLCKKASEWGFDGLELACWGDHFEVDKALSNDTYCARKRELLEKYALQLYAISNPLVGQAVLDNIETPLDLVIGQAKDALVRRQNPDGHWVFELEADATIPPKARLDTVLAADGHVTESTLRFRVTDE